MPLIIGHSQVKYFSEYLDSAEFSVFAYPGYRTRQFLKEEVLQEVIPYFSVVVLVVGANDIGRGRPAKVMGDIEELCDLVYYCSPSSTILVSEILPCAQNCFPGSVVDEGRLQRWNREASEVNGMLRHYASGMDGVEVIPHTQFHTTFGVNRGLLSRDGLHLSLHGNETFVENVEVSVRNCARATVSVVSVRSLAPVTENVESVVPFRSVGPVSSLQSDTVLMHVPKLYSEALKEQVDLRSDFPCASDISSVRASVPESVPRRTSGSVVVCGSAPVSVSVSVSDPGQWQYVSYRKKHSAPESGSTGQRQSVSSRKKQPVTESGSAGQRQSASSRKKQTATESAAGQVQSVSSRKKQTVTESGSAGQRQSVSSRKKQTVTESGSAGQRQSVSSRN